MKHTKYIDYYVVNKCTTYVCVCVCVCVCDLEYQINTKCHRQEQYTVWLNKINYIS